MYRYLFSRSTLIATGIFSLILCLLYGWMQLAHARVPFHTLNYVFNAHHFMADPRMSGHHFSLVDSLDQYDVQWYMRIAAGGYPTHPASPDFQNRAQMQAVTYAFFPLYPLVLKAATLVIHPLPVAAFVTTLSLALLTFLSLRFAFLSWFGQKVGQRATWLFFLLPISIFLYAPYSDSLRLLLLVWFSYFLTKKRLYLAALFLACANIVSGTSWLLLVVLVYWAYKNGLKRTQILLLFSIALIPLVLWVLFNWYQTGDMLFFLHVRQFGWAYGMFPFLPFLTSISVFFALPLHSFHFSQLDTLVGLVGLIGLLVWWKNLPEPLGLTTLILWATPLMVSDTMSYMRYSLALFPLIGVACQKLTGWKYVLTLLFSGLFLGIVSLLFINWWWIG